jgi:hypothetical protein
MSEQTNITDLIESGIHIGWVYQEDGKWYSRPRSEGNRPKFGPFKNADRARTAVLEVTRFGRSLYADGAWALITLSERDTHTWSNRQASGSVTYLTTDDTDSHPKAIEWEVDAGVPSFNAWSGAGTALQTEAKGEAMMEAVKQAAMMVKELQREVTA